MGKRPHRHKAKTLRDQDAADGTRSRAVWIALSLASVLALQLWTCWGKFGIPFLDTRLHYNYDNADYTFRARSGNRNGDLRSQFGITLNTYSTWGERTGRPSYYTDHPFLVKALFQQYSKVAGTTEWVSRSFYLLVSFAIANGLYTILLLTTGNLLTSLAGTLTLVSLPLFAVYQTCVKFETDGMLIGVWLFVALIAYLRRGTSRALLTYGSLTGLAFLVHWTAVLFVAVIGGYLLVATLRRTYPTARRALLVTIAASALGFCVLLGLMTYLQRSWASARAVLVRALAIRSSAIPAAVWWPRQWLYLKQNFTGPFLVVALGLSLFLAGKWVRAILHRENPGSQHRSVGLLPVFGASTAIVAVVWLVAFPQGSFIHIYWQYWFCLSAATLVGAFLASLRTTRRSLVAGGLGCGVLVIYLLSATRVAYAGVLRDQLGTPEDVAFLGSLREDRFTRMVFVPLSNITLNQWFSGPLFEYYTDRPVVVATAPSDVKSGDKMLVLRYQQRPEVVSRLTAWSLKSLSNEKCGPRLCAYDVRAN